MPVCLLLSHRLLVRFCLAGAHGLRFLREGFEEQERGRCLGAAEKSARDGQGGERSRRGREAPHRRGVPIAAQAGRWPMDGVREFLQDLQGAADRCEGRHRARHDAAEVPSHMPGLIGLRCVAQDWVGPSLRFCTCVCSVGPSSQDGCCDTLTYTLGASIANRIFEGTARSMWHRRTTRWPRCSRPCPRPLPCGPHRSTTRRRCGSQERRELVRVKARRAYGVHGAWR